MARLNLRYLWPAKGRHMIYWYYRSGKLRIPIKAPEGRRLTCGDFGFIEAYERIHASFSTERRTAAYTGTVAHGIDGYRADAKYSQLKPKSKKTYDFFLNWLEIIMAIVTMPI